MSNENDKSALDGARLDTLAVRAGISRTGEGEHSEPVFLTSSYVFDNAAEAAARFSGDLPGNVYSRYTNPTVRSFEHSHSRSNLLHQRPRHIQIFRMNQLFTIKQRLMFLFPVTSPDHPNFVADLIDRFERLRELRYGCSRCLSNKCISVNSILESKQDQPDGIIQRHHEAGHIRIGNRDRFPGLNLTDK